MHSIKEIIKLLICLTQLTRKFNIKPLYGLFFVHYLFIKINKLLKMQLKLSCISNEAFSFLVMKHGKCNEFSVDNNLYILCNYKTIEKPKNWYYLCCKSSKRKYKVAVIFTDDVPENTIYVSESMKLNVNKRLSVKESSDCSYLLTPVPVNSISYASEMKISLICNPYYDCKNDDLISTLLQNFFTAPKYLRPNDIFSINVKKYVPEIKYCAGYLQIEILHFKVNNIKTENEENNENGNFIVYDETTLIQETNVNSFYPEKCLCNFSRNLGKYYLNKWPSALKESFQQIQSCIAPFLQNNIFIDVKPVFLVEGPVGCGKSKLVKTAAESFGLHLMKADFTEVQSLTSAQTEAKLRIILNDAERCIPCVLLLQNIQIFGINSEGQKDDRVLSSFSFEIKKLYSKKMKYPMIIIATSNDSEISIDSERTFLEKIKIDRLEQDQRCEILSWLIENKGLKHQVDLERIAKMCSDFVLADFEALVLHAIKNCLKSIHMTKENDTIELSNDDFIHACEYMQSMFSNQIGAPRVPKIYWEDIGGLADLKHEIMRRIEMPLLNIPGMGKSGLLLYGPPGTGKTLLAKAVATECQLHFLSVKGPELLNMYVGQSEKNIRQVFERARAAAPCIIFFDELDSLAPNRGQSGDSGGVMDRVVSQLLAEMDGLESTGHIFIIAATNRPDLVDPALLRPGRFDKMLYVGIYSDPDSQLSVLKALTRHFNMEMGGEELETLTKQLPRNLTGADLYSVCSNAWLRAVRRTLTSVEVGRENITGDSVLVKLEDFVHVSKELVPSVSKEEMLRYEKLRDELSMR